MAHEKILVVDDEPIMVTAFQQELGREGFQVEGASNPDEALEKVKSAAYDVIFIDYVLPGMNGVELCKAVKKICPEATLVFFTGKVRGFDPIAVETEFKQAGGEVYFLYKPFVAGELLEMTKKALAKRSLRKP